MLSKTNVMPIHLAIYKNVKKHAFPLYIHIQFPREYMPNCMYKYKSDIFADYPGNLLIHVKSNVGTIGSLL